MKQVFDSDKLTDMEVAFKLLRLMDDYDDPRELNKAQRTSNVAIYNQYVKWFE